jgi:hypothetical protein
MILNPGQSVVNKKIHGISRKKLEKPLARRFVSLAGDLGGLGNCFRSDFVKKITNFRLTFLSRV